MEKINRECLKKGKGYMVSLSIIILSVFAFICFLVFLPSYLTHIEMNKSEKFQYCFVTFSSFFRIFNSFILEHPDLEWTYHYGSYFAKDIPNKDKSLYWEKPYMIYIHASIIKIEDVCYIMYPFSWISYNLWLQNHARGHIENIYGKIKEAFY